MYEYLISQETRAKEKEEEDDKRGPAVFWLLSNTEYAFCICAAAHTARERPMEIFKMANACIALGNRECKQPFFSDPSKIAQ